MLQHQVDLREATFSDTKGMMKKGDSWGILMLRVEEGIRMEGVDRSGGLVRLAVFLDSVTDSCRLGLVSKVESAQKRTRYP